MPGSRCYRQVTDWDGCFIGPSIASASKPVTIEPVPRVRSYEHAAVLAAVAKVPLFPLVKIALVVSICYLEKPEVSYCKLLTIVSEAFVEVQPRRKVA